MKRKISLYLICLLLVCSFAACSKDNTIENTENSYSQLLNGFEDLQSYYDFTVNDSFGAICKNTNKAFVTEGDASLMLDVHGDFRSVGEEPSISIALSNAGEVDLSRFKSLAFDMFNAQQQDIEIKLSLTIDGATVGEHNYMLKPGKNSVLYAPDVKYVAVICDLKKGEKLNIAFPAVRDPNQESKKYYLDNLVYNKTILEHKTLEIELDENEFCSFDKEYQAYVTGTWAVGPTNSECLPTLSINTDLKYCKNNTGKSLKMYMPTGNAPLDNGTPSVTFATALCKKIDWVKLKEENYYLVFDFYNSGAVLEGNVEFRSHVSHAEGHSPLNKVPTYSVAFTAKTGWNEIRVPLGAIDDNVSVSKPEPLSENVGTVAVHYRKFAGNPRIGYLDNFRFEKSGE